jgi:hypothetical protein
MGRGPTTLGDAARNGVQIGFGASGLVSWKTISSHYHLQPDRTLGRSAALIVLAVGLVSHAVLVSSAWPPSDPREASQAVVLTKPPDPMALPKGRDSDTRSRITEAYGQLPLSFEKNEGQTDGRVEFMSRGRGYAMFLSRGGEAVLVLTDPAGSNARAPDAAGRAIRPDLPGPLTPDILDRNRKRGRDAGAALRLKLVGANKNARAEGSDQLPGRVNYLRGKDPKQWRSDIPTYARVAYDEVYPGVDVVYYGNQRQLEYDFIVDPGADPRAITLEVEGAERLEIDESGDLVLYAGGKQVRQRKPVVYQETNGVRRVIDGRYRFDGSHRVKFELASYDRSVPLVIDPVLVYSTYLGGAFTGRAFDSAFDVAIDPLGNAYVTGYTLSSDFPTTGGAYDTSWNNSYDVFVTKLDPAGATLAYSTFLGGSSDEYGRGVAVDVAGHAYVTGHTSSSDFPTTGGAYDTSRNNSYDVFVTKLDPTGGALAYSTFLGGSNYEEGHGVAVDVAGAAYVTGYTFSGDFPATGGAYDTSWNNSADVFMTKLDPTGEALAYSTFLGGSSDETGEGVAVDAAGNTYLTGFTVSSNFPTTGGAYDTNWNGSYDVFVTKLDPTGAALVYSTFLGGSSDDYGFGVAVDGAGAAYVTGYTSSSNFPTTSGAYDTSWNNSYDVFVTKLAPTGGALAYSTFLGGGSSEEGRGVAVDAAGNAYIAGYTCSTDFPATPGAFDTSASGCDGFVTKLNPAGSAPLLYSTYLGGGLQPGGYDVGFPIAVDGTGSAYVTGHTGSVDFPTTLGAYDTSWNNSTDVFVTKLDPGGATLAYSTFLGGTSDEFGQGIAVDVAGNAYVTGSTLSSNFPTTGGAYDTSWNNSYDVFVTKLDPAGATLAYSTFLGGGSDEYGSGVAVDVAGHAYVTGHTSSSDFPTTGGADDTSWNNSADVFVTKLDPAGATLAYSTFLGGSSDEYGQGVAVDGAGAAYVTGYTFSGNFPTTGGAYDTSWNLSYDMFVTKLLPTGGALEYSTFLGGSSDDIGQGVAVDGAGAAYVTGYTVSSNFPTTGGAYDTSWNNSVDVLVTKLNSTGGALAYSTFLGGSSDEYGQGVAVDAAGNAYVTGFTHSSDFPTTAGAYDTSWNNSVDVFVTKLNPTGGALAYSTFLGGSSDEYGQGVAVDAAGNAYVTGFTHSSDFPTTAGAYDTSYNGAGDVFVTRIGNSGPPATLTISPAAATNTVGQEHCVTAAVEDVAGNRVPRVTVRFSVAGASSDGGSDTTNANGEAAFCYGGPPLPGGDTITAYADADNDSVRDPTEPTGAATKAWILPVATRLCEITITNGGRITAANGDRASFGGNARADGEGNTQGRGEYRDHGPAQPANVHSNNVLAITCDGPGREATIYGQATIDGAGSFFYRIRVRDLGEPGVGMDTYWILLGNGYDSGDKTLDGGNVQIRRE